MPYIMSWKAGLYTPTYLVYPVYICRYKRGGCGEVKENFCVVSLYQVHWEDAARYRNRR
jgi:hypothetical protein